MGFFLAIQIISHAGKLGFMKREMVPIMLIMALSSSRVSGSVRFHDIQTPQPCPINPSFVGHSM